MAQSVVEISVHAFKLRRPCRERVGFVIVEHVAHGEAERVQIILNAQQLQRVFSIAIDEIILQFAKAGNLPRDVAGITYDSGKRDDQSKKESASRRLRGAQFGVGRSQHVTRIQRCG